MTVENQLDDGLTEEERAALNDDDGGDDTASQLADGEGEHNAHEEGQQPPATDPPADGQAAEAAAPAASEAEQQPTADASQAQPQPAPILVAQVSEGAEARLTEIGTKKDALLEQFDNGDITAREYQKQLDALNRDERQLEYQINEAKLAEKMNQQRLQNDWTETCNRFVDTHAVYKDNPRLYKALDAEVRELAAKPETANWSGQRFLDEAHKNLKAAFGFQDAAAPAPQKKPAAQRDDLPPNLAKVPAADVEDTNGGRFAVLDRLAATDPIGYEETLNKMSAAERDAYLSA